MKQSEAEQIEAVAKRLHRYAEHIEITWDGMHEVVTYADLPLAEVLKHTAIDLLDIVEGAADEAAK